jgi:hypothetical protein
MGNFYSNLGSVNRGMTKVQFKIGPPHSLTQLVEISLICECIFSIYILRNQSNASI